MLLVALSILIAIIGICLLDTKYEKFMPLLCIISLFLIFLVAFTSPLPPLGR